MTRKKTTEHPWLSSYPSSLRWDTEIEAHPVPFLLDESEHSFSERTAIDFLGKRYTYGDIGDEVGRLARGLQSLGVGKGTKVGLFLPNSPHYIIAYYAILKVGATVVNLNPLLTFTELKKQILDSQTTILFTINIQHLFKQANSLHHSTPIDYVIVADFLESLPFLKRKMFGWFRSSELAVIPYGLTNLSWQELTKPHEGAFSTVSLDPEKDIAVLQYTGGTTGIPKAAMLTHANVYSNVIQCGMWFEGSREVPEKVIAVLPFFHAFSMTAVMNLSILKGYEMILHPRFDLDMLIEDISTKRPTLLFAVPTILQALLRSPKTHRAMFASLKYCVSGGAPLPVEIKTRFEELSGVQVIEGYGLTESSPVLTANPLEGDAREGSVGLPLPGTTIQIRDTTGRRALLKANEIGEVVAIGPQIMAGYYNSPEETKEVIRTKRLHTGDLGYLDKEGFLYIVDRLKEVIICGGFNIYPREIEDVLYEHPSVLEAAVIGVEDEMMGEVPKAVIVLKDGHSVTPEELCAFLGGKIAKKKQPRIFEFHPSLPKTLIGKIAKKELKKK